jgi:hypothetical protein
MKPLGDYRAPAHPVSVTRHHIDDKTVDDLKATFEASEPPRPAIT